MVRMHLRNFLERTVPYDPHPAKAEGDRGRFAPVAYVHKHRNRLDRHVGRSRVFPVTITLHPPHSGKARGRK
jgi:hypothetical protein